MRCLAIVGVVMSLLLLVAPAVAQEATPNPLPTVPGAAECRAEPRTVASVLAARASGTPVPMTSVDREDRLPKGIPADEDTVTAVTAVEREFAACYNAADWLRALSLFTDNALRAFAADFQSDQEISDFLATAGTPEADASGQLAIVLHAVRDVRISPDGRVGAVVEWGRSNQPDIAVDEVNFHIYVESNGRWLLDEEISGFAPWYQDDGTPPAWQSA